MILIRQKRTSECSIPFYNLSYLAKILLECGAQNLNELIRIKYQTTAISICKDEKVNMEFKISSFFS